MQNKDSINSQPEKDFEGIKTRIRIIKEPIKREELKRIAEERYGDLVKAVVDVEKKVMALGGVLHSDEEGLLLKNNSSQENLWGINIYPDKFDKDPEEWIEFDSIINIRPSQGNRSRFVEDKEIRRKIINIVKSLIID